MTQAATKTREGEMSPTAVRREIRAGRVTGTTAGYAWGKLQGNLAIVPAALADDFQAFCDRNPKPCPVAGVGRPGDPKIPALGEDLDIRTDLPRYNIYRDGALSEQVDDLTAIWRDDLVAFVLGCSFSFEQKLIDSGIPLRHITDSSVVAMYKSNIETTPVGPFAGPMVVSMRPLPKADVARAEAITARFPHAHGAPIHAGDPAVLGIGDIERPDWGDPPGLRTGEVPVFWACGVTPQAALSRARVPFCITHAPGSMLITDRDVDGLSPTP